MRQDKGPKVFFRMLFPVLVIIGFIYFFKDDISIRNISGIDSKQTNMGDYTIIKEASREGYVDDESFRKKGNRSVILFTSTWCGSCDYLEKTFKEESAKSEYTNVKFYEIDIDQNWELANRLNVKVTPSIVFIDDIDFATKSEISEKDIAGEDSDLVFFLPGGVFNLDFYERKR